MARYIARFVPQAWVNDYAIEIDHNGEPDEWDCTREFGEMPESYRNELLERMAKDDVHVDEALDRDDWLKNDPDAPEWVREHHGPFDIYVRENA